MVNQVINIVHKPPPHPQSQTAKNIQNFSLKSQMEQLHDYLKELRKEYYSSQFYKSYLSYKQIFKTQVYKPITSAYKHTYNQFPEETTRIKLNWLQNINFDSRFIMLNAIALTSAILTLRGVNQFNGLMTTVKCLRNTALTYGFGGLVLAPQIYNPLINKAYKAEKILILQ